MVKTINIQTRCVKRVLHICMIHSHITKCEMLGSPELLQQLYYLTNNFNIKDRKPQQIIVVFNKFGSCSNQCLQSVTDTDGNVSSLNTIEQLLALGASRSLLIDSRMCGVSDRWTMVERKTITQRVRADGEAAIGEERDDSS